MLREVYEQYHDRGSEIIGMDVEKGASLADVRAFLKEKDILWPNAQPATIREFVENRLQILAFPTKS